MPSTSSSANRTSLAYVLESTPGVTPASPRMRTCRFTGEALTFTPEYQDSDEIRADRMNDDPTQTISSSAGTVNYELSYPHPRTFLGDALRSALYASWVDTPQRDNDGTAGSAITDIGTTPNTLACISGAAFAVGHLVRTSGFALAANNGVNRVTTGGAASFAASGAAYVAEASPAATARAKVVGFQGAAGDIQATSTGLSSTTLDFTTLGLAVGQWIKIGGTATGDRFATAALNDFARIIAVAAHALTLDNLPSGWGADAGTGKTLKVWFGDQIRNGATPSAISQVSATIEKGFTGQASPNYLRYFGQTVGQMTLNVASRGKVNGQITYMGMGGGLFASPLSATPDPATTSRVMAANAHVGRVSEAGMKLSGPNWIKEISISINNNLRQIDDIGSSSPVAIEEGEFTVTATPNTLFGDGTLLSKFYNGVATSLSAVFQRAGQAVVMQLPRVTYRGDGQPQATAKNTSVMVNFTAQASRDPLTGAHLLIDRMEYFEA